MARLLHFTFIPLLIVLAYLFQYSRWPLLIKRSISGALLLGTLLLMIGEPVSQSIHERYNEDIFSSIQDMQTKINFQANDLILTKNGAEHICNWFLNTKAGVITALHKSDFETYNRIFILNPQQGQTDFNTLKGKRADDEKDRYYFMMHAIPPPKSASSIYRSEYLELWELKYLPEEWAFDEKGYWGGYEY